MRDFFSRLENTFRRVGEKIYDFRVAYLNIIFLMIFATLFFAAIGALIGVTGLTVFEIYTYGFGTKGYDVYQVVAKTGATVFIFIYWAALLYDFISQGTKNNADKN